MSVTKGFGDRLAHERREKAWRDRRDISQKDVAEAIGSSGPSVSRWESGLGVPGDAMLDRLARYFGVTLGWLRYGQEPRMYPVVRTDELPVSPNLAAGPLTDERARQMEEEIQAKRGKGKKRSNRRA